MSTQPPIRPVEPTHEHAPELEVLIGRLLDGQAAEMDVERLASLASKDAGAWRLFGERQRDHLMLTSRVAAELQVAQRVSLPHRPRQGAVIHVIRRAHAYVAWAAAIALALVVGVGQPSELPSARTVDRESIDAGPPRSTSEFDPIILDTKLLPDGRTRMWWLRRIIEEVDVDDFDEALDMKTIDGSEVIPRQ